jgi:hypothetical protein
MSATTDKDEELEASIYQLLTVLRDDAMRLERVSSYVPPVDEYVDAICALFQSKLKSIKDSLPKLKDLPTYDSSKSNQEGFVEAVEKITAIIDKNML